MATIVTILFMGIGPSYALRHALLLLASRKLKQQILSDQRMQLTHSPIWRTKLCYEGHKCRFRAAFQPDLHIELQLAKPLAYPILIHHADKYPLHRNWKPWRPGQAPTGALHFDQLINVRAEAELVAAWMDEDTRNYLLDLLTREPDLCLTHEKIEYIAPPTINTLSQQRHRQLISQMLECAELLEEKRALCDQEKMFAHMLHNASYDPDEGIRLRCVELLHRYASKEGWKVAQERALHDESPSIRLFVVLLQEPAPHERREWAQQLWSLAIQPQTKNKLRLRALKELLAHPLSDQKMASFLWLCSEEPDSELRVLARKKLRERKRKGESKSSGHLSVVDQKDLSGGLSHTSHGEVTLLKER